MIGVTTDAAGNVIPIVTNGNTTDGSNTFGGRIIRILPDGTVNEFAYGFDTNGAQDSSSFVNSMSDHQLLGGRHDDVRLGRRTGSGSSRRPPDLAGSTSGTLVGLNDLRTLGVPYDGQNSAVAVVDTGVDASSPPFRGRVAPGQNLFTGGLGNVDTAASMTTAATGGGGGGGGGGTGTNVLANTVDGHGTPVAGVIAQFVPQATLVPVNIFLPFNAGKTLSHRRRHDRRRRRRWRRRAAAAAARALARPRSREHQTP